MAYYALHKFHWKPSEILTLPSREKAFILAAIQKKAEVEKKENDKLKAKKPRKHKR